MGSTSRRQKIAFIIPALSDGGAQVQCLRLLEQVSGDPAFDIALFYMHDGVHSDTLKKSEILAVRVPPVGRSNYDPRNIARLHSALAEFQADAVFTWLHACDVYGFFLHLLKPSRPWIMAERDSSYPREFRYRLREKLGRFADRIVCNSEAGRGYWRALGAKVPIDVVCNIVATPPLVERDAVRARTVLTVGRLEPQKNPLVTVEAFCLLAAQRPELDFEIVGEGSLRADAEAIVARHAMIERVRFAGFRKDARERIGAARLLVTMSRHEGTPNVLLEGVAAETPVVASAIPEHLAVLGDDYRWSVQDYRNPAACAEMMARVLDAGDVAGDLEYGREQLGRMSAEAVAGQYRAIFAEVVASSRPRA